MLCLTIRAADRVWHLPLPAREAWIGRAKENDIVIPLRSVSARHARLVHEGDGYILVDAGSTNGLRVEGARTNRIELRRGASVGIGGAAVSLDEADTGDVGIAMTVRGEHRVPSRSEGTTDAGGALGGESAALHLVAALAREDLHPRRHAQQIADRVRAVLRANGVTLLRIEREDAGVIAGAGAALPETVIRAIAARREGRGTSADRVRDAAYLASLHRDRGVVTAAVAWFDHDAPLLAWQEDCFASVAMHLLGRAPRREASAASEPVHVPRELVYASAVMRRLVEEVVSLAKVKDPILIVGETGTGKELLARMLHATGPYARGKLVAFNSAGLPAQLADAELFGVEAGAATDTRARLGLFGEAAGGTAFLDEIAELPLNVQAKLLRMLQEGELRRVGSDTIERVGLRIIAATNQPQNLRDDIRYRFAVHLTVPPLRDRREDIEPLVLHFLQQAANAGELDRLAISFAALDRLRQAEWAGNVRELRNVVLNAARRHGAARILQLEHFDDVPSAPIAPGVAVSNDLDADLDARHRIHIEDALRRHRGNLSAVARELQRSPNYLRKLIARLGIQR